LRQKRGFSRLLFGNPGFFVDREAVEILVEIAWQPLATSSHQALWEDGHVLGWPSKGRIIKYMHDVNGP
jgi:hypothetical protein